MSVRIITDSAGDFSDEEIRSWGIVVMPVKLHFGEEEYLDGVTMNHDEFYSRLIEKGEIPHTSQITPFEFDQAFTEAEEAGDEAVVLTLASKLSGTYQSACVAAQDHEGIYVVDSTNATIGMKILVELAVRLRDQGMGAKEMAAKLEEEKKEICLLAVLDTLEYLKKGGRISPAVATVGMLMNIKPVACIRDGEILVLGKARGTKNAFAKLDEVVEKEGGIDFDKPLCFGYSGRSDEMLVKYKTEHPGLYKGHVDEMPVTSVGCTIGTHIGPGTILVSYFRKH